MLTPIFTTQFKKDVKQQQKRRKDMNKLRDVSTLLIDEQKLPAIYNDLEE